MFTGIIETSGLVRTIEPAQENGVRITVEVPFAGELTVGESVCVDGACVTVVRHDERLFAADLSPETLRRTRFSGLRPGQRVNLERSLRLGDRLGGHLVTGHVDGIGRVSAVRALGGGFVEMAIEPPANLLPLIVEKGSVAVDGVSLTVAALHEAEFQVALIPQTLAVTTLSERRSGDLVNLEADILGKYVARLLGAPPADWPPALKSGHEAGFA